MTARVAFFFAASVLALTSCRDRDHIIEKRKSVYRHDDTLLINKHLFVEDKLLGDYYFNERPDGDMLLRTHALARRARDHKPLSFDFTHDGEKIAVDTIGHATARLFRYEGVMPR